MMDKETYNQLRKQWSDKTLRFIDANKAFPRYSGYAEYEDMCNALYAMGREASEARNRMVDAWHALRMAEHKAWKTLTPIGQQEREAFIKVGLLPATN